MSANQHTAGETAPLLSADKSRSILPTRSAPYDGTGTSSPSDTAAAAPSAVDDAPPPPADPAEQQASLIRWSLFWLIFALLVAYLVTQAIREGGGKFDWSGALSKSLGGGLSGALAMVIQVFSLMPLRTIMNYQYRYGGKMMAAVKTLWGQGGFPRYYAGLAPALVQGPLARFGDTAANVGILALLSSNPFLNKMPSPLKTFFASIAAALFRMILVPIDTLKTTMQTAGSANAIKILRDRIKAYGVGTLWYGAFATAAASFVGSFPWFTTYNYLSEVLPPSTSLATKLLRQAFIGFCASVVSDTVSNSLRVLKTYRQVNHVKISYRAAAARIISTEGYVGLFGRGLGTRILANGLQGIMFSVLWKLFQDIYAGKDGNK